MPDLIITRDIDNTDWIKVWSADKSPTLDGKGFEFNGSRHLFGFQFLSGHMTDLPPGHSARLVLADVTDHRPVPPVEWVTVGCIDVATSGDRTAFVRPYCGVSFLGEINDGKEHCGDLDDIPTRAEARSWCEAELRKAVQQ